MLVLVEWNKLDYVSFGNLNALSKSGAEKNAVITHLFCPPFPKTHRPSSASSVFIFVKSAMPTPTMIMDMGRRDARMIACTVSLISDISPSVNISNTKYCYIRKRMGGSILLLLMNTYSWHAQGERDRSMQAAVHASLMSPEF